MAFTLQRTMSPVWSAEWSAMGSKVHSSPVHLVSAIQGFQISNNKGHANGWVTANALYGKLVKVEP